MANEEFKKIMATLREREERLNSNLAALEEESRAYARDHRELLLAIERDQGPSRPPQHPVTEALNAFHSTQVFIPSAVASESEAQPAADEDSLFVPENACVDDSTAVDAPRPKRRVTFSDAPATIMGGMTPSQHQRQETANVNCTDEPTPLRSLPDDVSMGYDQPVSTGERRPIKRARHSIGTSALMPHPGFTSTSSEAEAVKDPDDPRSVPVPSGDTNLGVETPVYTGDRRPFERARHSSRTLKLTLNTGFTPIMRDNKPALDPHDFIDTYNPVDFGTYDSSNPIDGPIEPLESTEFDHMSVGTDDFLPDFVCPYPDCWKLYATSDDVEEHLRHDHPDWALIRDTVNDPNSM